MALRMASRTANRPSTSPMPQSRATPIAGGGTIPREVLQQAQIEEDSSSSYESTDPGEYLDPEYREA